MAVAAGGDDMVVIVQIQGANAADFSLVTDAYYLLAPAGGFAKVAFPVVEDNFTTFEIKFTPNDTGVRTAEIVIWSNDFTDADDVDESTYTFKIQGTGAPLLTTPVISLMTPNGGESWPAGSEQWISWNSANVASGAIEYSMDGTTWKPVASGVNMSYGSYLWTLPQGASPNSRVRISGGGKSDTSAAVFSITSTPPVTVTDISIIPAPASKTAAGSVAPGTYLILADLNSATPTQNVRVLTWAKTGLTSLTVQEYYSTRDADSDGDIDLLSGSVTEVVVGRFTLPQVGPVIVGVTAVITGPVSYYNVAYQEDVTIVQTPTEFSVSGFYPNPFNPVTTIQFSLPEESQVRLSVYDITGREVAVLEEGFFRAGTYTTMWRALDANGNRVSSGLYLYRMTAGGYTATGKVLFLK
jgi:hypothetical protein